MTIHKYCANGNDFLIFHTFMQQDFATLARGLCHRHSGIGADGLVVLLPHLPPHTLDSGATSSTKPPESTPTLPPIAYRWDFYNADGSRANMCGNASRCVAHYAYHMGLAPAKHAFITSVQHDIIEVCVESNPQDRTQAQESMPQVSGAMACAIVASNLGRYRDLTTLPAGRDVLPDMPMPASLANLGMEWAYIDTGVPHVVGFLPDHRLLQGLIAKDTSIGTEILSFMRALRRHYNANVNLAYAQSPDLIYLATYERGVEDITLACGTGMAAVLLVGHIMLGLDSRATLIPPSGERPCLWCEHVGLESKADSSARGVDSAYPAMRVFLQGEVRLVAVCETGLGF